MAPSILMGKARAAKIGENFLSPTSLCKHPEGTISAKNELDHLVGHIKLCKSPEFGGLTREGLRQRPVQRWQNGAKMTKSNKMVPSKHPEGIVGGKNECHHRVALVKLCKSPDYGGLIRRGLPSRRDQRPLPGGLPDPQGLSGLRSPQSSEIWFAWSLMDFQTFEKEIVVKI